jgi:hypothetical protein
MIFAYLKNMVVHMKLVETNCATCGSSIYVYEDYLRQEMYCTLHCMESADNSKIMVKEYLGPMPENMA